MKILKWIIGILLALAVVGAIAVAYMSEDTPEHVPTAEADALADKMMMALNKPAWDTLSGLKWEFPGGHKYVWNKKANTATVSWGSNLVNINLDDQTGTATDDGQPVTGDALESLLQTAWSYWCNDSFWMFAPFKAKDPNTSRSIVNHEGRDALMVSYEGGGVTPGDKYMWILDDQYRPTAYKMWVSIIPVGGMEFSWEDWITLPSGAMVATTHKGKAFTLNMEGVEEVQF